MDSLFIIGGLVLGYLIYAKGVRDGIALEKGHKPAIIPNPIQKAVERKQEAKKEEEDKAVIDAINNMMSYDGFKQKVGD